MKTVDVERLCELANKIRSAARAAEVSRLTRALDTVWRRLREERREAANLKVSRDALKDELARARADGDGAAAEAGTLASIYLSTQRTVYCVFTFTSSAVL